MFRGAKFKNGLSLNRARIGGDVILGGVSACTINFNGPPIQLNESEIDGQLVINGLHSPSISAREVKARSIYVALEDLQKSITDLSGGEAAWVIIQSSSLKSAGDVRPHSSVGELRLENRTVTRELAIRYLDLGTVGMAGLKVRGGTILSPDVRIRELLDLSNASLGSFQWVVAMCGSLPSSGHPCWPAKEMRTQGLSFSELNIGSDRSIPTATFAEPAGNLDDSFLARSTYSESAFTTYEQLLQSRGKVSHADHVYQTMRRLRRSENWRTASGKTGHMQAGLEYFLGCLPGVFSRLRTLRFPASRMVVCVRSCRHNSILECIPDGAFIRKGRTAPGLLAILVQPGAFPACRGTWRREGLAREAVACCPPHVRSHSSACGMDTHSRSVKCHNRHHQMIHFI